MLLSPGFPLSLLSEPCHDALLSKRSDIPLSNRLKLLMFLGGIPPLLFRPEYLFCPITVPLSRLEICGVRLRKIFNEFTGMPLFLFRPKSILLLSQRFCLLEDNPWSPIPHVSMEALAWLVWMSVLSDYALLIVSSSEPIVISNNETCSILVRLVFVYWYVINWFEIYYLREWTVMVLIVHFWCNTCWGNRF